MSNWSATHFYAVTYTLGSPTFTTSSLDLNTSRAETIQYSNSSPDLAAGSSFSASNGPDLDKFTYVGAAYTGSGATTTYIGFIALNTATGTYFFFDESGTATTGTYGVNTGVGWDLNGAPACFMAGTAVRTPAGDVAVETLKAGDLVTLSDGRTAPVSWLGRQTVSMTFADPLRVQPIRVKADALGEGLPARDLLLSADHALLVDGILVQAGALVNGVSVVREFQIPSTFIYYHVEVADHSLILAENVPAETFVDNVDRMGFDNWEEHQALVGDTTIAEMEYPRAQAARQVPQAIRARLLARGEALFGKVMVAA